MRKKRLLSATFEQSKKVVSKKILTEDGAQIGLMSSMSFLKRIAALLIGLFFIGLLYAVGVGLPRFILMEPEETRMLSESTINWIHLIGVYTTGITEKLLVFHIILFFVNLIRKPNYAFQLAYGNLTVILLIMEFTTGILPFIVGLTVGAFGWIGFALQLLVCIYLWQSLVLSSVNQLKQQLYKEAPAGKDWGDRLMVLIKKYGGILLLLSIINRWTFNFGEVTKGRPDIFSFLYGWAFLLVASLMIFMMSMTLKNFVAAFYFFKYQKEYRQFFNVTNEQWYGKWRGKKMDKKKQKEK
ncbi:hypothetical protein GGG87_02875 [Streptococcus sp. zg-86]|uniref:DUF975 family protein n=1 Tax=Streptococcus zhangguiae TaxID=2664091 RepID=A0ABW9R1K6_9STRE|nr:MULTISPECIES: hypothetical protein [unclassified Streptococcus]MTB63944.1 hypothetical protein [Streptococcus sp. zg-86]MTB90254.1 hypothetical protein [Streptococcus sp. zg-36]QTH46973.1 hypothetical protein J5M87_05235 [Streptococcus sp. zg-86]